MSPDGLQKLHNIDAEHAVINGILNGGIATLDRVQDMRQGHFFSEPHRLIFAEMRSMAIDSLPIDVITVAERLHARGLEERTGGLAYLGELAANTPSSSNVARYGRIVIDKSVERELMAAAQSIIGIVSGVGMTAEKLAKSQAAVMAITEQAEPRQPKPLREVLERAIGLIERRREGLETALGTGLDVLDRQLNGGLRRGNLAIIAGRPGMGKTALGAGLALHAAMNSVPTLFLSMEMADTELADRLLASAGRVSLSAVLAGSMDGEDGHRIFAGLGKIHDLPLFIDEQGGLTLYDIASKARSVKRKHGLGLLVVDYLQLASGDGDNRNQEIEKISRGLKALAKELDIPVVVLSQLSRKVEERANRHPMLSDLRDSGAIEQDADIVLMCYRDEYYNADSADRGTAEIIVAKNRQGAPGTVRVAYIAEQTRFESLAYDWHPEASIRPEKRFRKGFE